MTFSFCVVTTGFLLWDGRRRLFHGLCQSTGIALRNVADRVELFYGEGSGVEIMSKVGSGTCVTLRLVGVAPKATSISSDEWDEEE